MANLLVISTLGGQAVMFDPERWVDVSTHVTPGEQLNAFHLPKATFEPFQMGSFIGSVELGGPVRCDVVTVAPHGNATHTECVGHIAGAGYSVIDCMTEMADVAQLITVTPENVGGQLMITRTSLENAWKDRDIKTLIIRTLPNEDSKRVQQWSGANPPFIHIDAMHLIVEHGVRHLMVDLPSVDAEEDSGALVAHHAFWQWPSSPRVECTITELIFVPNTVADGMYLVIFNVAPFNGDAAPSRPVLLHSFS